MIFIGFSHHDEAAARALALALRSAGVDVYCSAVPGTIKGGSFWQQIENAIDKCDAFVELCGTNPASKSSESEIVTANNRLARGSKFLIVPVLLPGVAPPSIHISLRAYECVELTGDPEHLSASEKSDLVERLRQLGALSPSSSSKSGSARMAAPTTPAEVATTSPPSPAESSSVDRESRSTPAWKLASFSLLAAAGLVFAGWLAFGDHKPPVTNSNAHDTATPDDTPHASDAANTDVHPTSDIAKATTPYGEWKLPTPQDGLVELGLDPKSKLAEFAVMDTGTIPSRDGSGEFVINARFAFANEKCALVLVLIPGGNYQMGSPDGAGIDNEHPQHLVNIKPFFIAKTEVTQALWERVMNSNPSRNQGALLPVTDISWVDAGKFCKKLDLARPTEAQWEYACRAGTTTRFSFGDDASELGQYAWFKTNPNSSAHAVATKLANPWGLHDVHGNVSEWCEDSYRDHYDVTLADGSAFVDAKVPSRVMRGGNCSFEPDYTRSAARGMYNASKGVDFVGFRPARSVRE